MGGLLLFGNPLVDVRQHLLADILVAVKPMDTNVSLDEISLGHPLD